MTYGGRAPSFSGRGGGRISSFQAHDLSDPTHGRGRGGGRFGRNQGRGKKVLNGNFMNSRDKGGAGANAAEETNAKLIQTKSDDILEGTLGFELFTEGEDKLGWLMTMSQSCLEDKDSSQVLSAVDCYFMCQDGDMFKARVGFSPYFYIQVSDDQEAEVEGWLRRKFEGMIQSTDMVMREDLDLKNHLSGLQRKLLKVSFYNSQQLAEVKREVVPIVSRNRAKSKTTAAYSNLTRVGGAGRDQQLGAAVQLQDVLDSIVDLREHDVPYHVRFAIDTDVRCGHWFTVKRKDGVTTMERRADLLQRAEPRICAWDIETTKLPLQFPNAEYDQVFMISYMIDKQGYLIVNREVVGEHISDFEYTPKPEFEGPFVVFNEPNEVGLLRKFLSHMKEAKPAIYVTYNGDFFDFPFVEKRCTHHGINFHQELGFKQASGGGGSGYKGNNVGGEWLSRHAVHMDCLHWVNRDSYLPQGSRGLKAVTKAKLGYDPVEVDPEDMLRMAAEESQRMASYSVSDAVSTYYLYMMYIHPFIFSLATVIPLPPDEVLRKGSGTLCEQLLMVQAYYKNILCPNKHTSEPENMYNGHLLESETYIGGKVEAIESGVFRSDLPMRFKCKPAAVKALMDKLDHDLHYAIVHEGKMNVEDIANYDAVREDIMDQLQALHDVPNREECPLIYHLDVAAMYPNIILTNRLQPSAIVEDEDCAACDFNKPDKTCLRKMEWVWRGEHFASNLGEYNQIKNQLHNEKFPPSVPGEAVRYWEDLSSEEKAKNLKDRLKKYTQKVYKRVLEKPITEEREAGICQRENSFYVDTVRAFRDRRYEYKGLNKVWKGKLETAKADNNPLRTAEAADMVVLYDSLQLAHKCILNSFYGYVMRKGARWYSMEMAGVVTYTGAKIIQKACQLVEQLGRPLELDTDGIWCTLPASFPENFKFKNKNGKEYKISYPGLMLNVLVAEHNTNPQYQTLVDPATRKYESSSEMSIEFEVDGPYKAMILPASKEEGKSIKKRYAVFNFDGSLAELKGFEIKRRGELKLIKVFQAEVFEKFLAGGTLEECYGAVAAVANRWLDMLDTQGIDLTDEELIEHISEATTMSKSLEEYEGRKSCAITCAKRLGEFLGDERIRDKGLNCKYVIAKRPENQPTSERAIPVSIFSSEPAVARAYLRKWCGEVGGGKGSHEVPDVRDIVDWGYYRERLSSAIQKIITIPAAMQQVVNPVQRVKHPDWLHKKLQTLSDKCQQLSLKETMLRQQRLKEQQQQQAQQAGAESGMAEGMSTTDAARAEGAEAEEHLAAEELIGEAEERGQERSMDDEDMEDMFSKAPNGPLTAAAAAAKKSALKAKSAALPGKENQGAIGLVNVGNTAAQKEVPLAGPKPKLGEDYGAWLQHQKIKWRQARGERKRRRAEALKEQRLIDRRGGIAAEGAVGSAALLGPAARADVGALFRQRAAAVTAVPWQLLQLAETGVHGRFKMWFLADGRLQYVHLTVPRTLYIDSEAAVQQQALFAGGGAGTLLADCRTVNRVLPDGLKPKAVLQVTMPEPEYRCNVSRLSAQLSAEHIHAVYEDALPLGLHAALQLGCVVKVQDSISLLGSINSCNIAPHIKQVNQSSQKKSLAGDWNLKDFQMKTSVECPYLEGDGPDGLGPLSYVSLYFSWDTTQSRAVLSCMMPAASRALMVVVQASSAAAREVTSNLLDRFWRDVVHGLKQQSSHNTQAQLSSMEKVEFSVEYCLDLLDAARYIQRQLAAWRHSTGRTPMLVACQGPVVSSRLQQQGLPLLGEFPCVDITPNADDCRYPTLQWQARAAKLALKRMAVTGGWLRERASLSRYAHVSLSNLGGDAAVAVADVLMARSLRDAQHVLWLSDPSLPDLGVEEKDPENSFGWDADGLVLLEGGGSGSTASSSSKHEVLAPGAYRSITVELRLHHLAVNAIDKAQQLCEMEGASGLEASGSGPAFKVLKSLVESWLLDAGKRNNPIANDLLMHLYRWISSPSSGLHRASLQHAVTALMAKLFAQLVAELRRLGATIVSANFNCIRLCTGKREVKDAVGYTKYLLEALKRRELFQWLDLTPVRWWHALLYRDQYNYGGVIAEVSEDVDMLEGNAVEAATEEQVVRTEEDATFGYYWSLLDYLPPAVKETMEVFLNEFVYLPWREVQRAMKTGSDGQADIIPTQVDATRLEEVQSRYLQSQLMSRFTERLLQLVAQVNRVAPGYSELREHQFPQRAGSHLTKEELGTPALAYVRTICHLMALDARVTDAVAVLRRQLLKLLHVREFGPLAEFKDMCLGFTLPDVICSYCNDCRDLDLCRDSELAAHEWSCGECQQPYDQAAMEQRLMVALQHRVRQYQLQDLSCVRCKQVLAGHFRNTCGLCSGDLKPTLPVEVLKKQLVVFRNIARFHGFELLEQLSDWTLQSHSGMQPGTQPV
ncbi:hypothetical protein CEUSTIGMA_g3069.t1 [Chlamydomonas eustigma]|uniref:DNA polymerase epsilon catalytic subunit n=1 Tax=Chlamydomonas eustigma TaxID=1157962 RepID=A0A250WXW4_9CHLO|nr:hypothetical protein CEUSTIGMA_g3069.t1 [Chlamydomonas eustigma]|eukprot:GAX75625.1 hypothetical protein CEUSTIGMA_g3069.t1 [Chlamydomonas eustigma]